VRRFLPAAIVHKNGNDIIFPSQESIVETIRSLFFLIRFLQGETLQISSTRHWRYGEAEKYAVYFWKE